MIGAPQHDLATLTLASQGKYAEIERGPHGAKPNRLDGRRLPCRQIEQQQHQQGPVHDQAGIELLMNGIVAVIVDAVCVVSQGRNSSTGSGSTSRDQSAAVAACSPAGNGETPVGMAR